MVTINAATDMNNIWISTFAVLTACFLAGCAHGSGSIRLSNNPLKVKEEALKEIPLGTPLKVAEEKMAKLGFKCEKYKGVEFGDQITPRGQRGEYKRYQNVDVVACSKTKVVPLVSDRTWVIGLVYNSEKVVTNVLVQVWSISVP